MGTRRLPLFLALGLLYSDKAMFTPPGWLETLRVELITSAATLFGFAASQFAIAMAKLRYIKARRTKATDEE